MSGCEHKISGGPTTHKHGGRQHGAHAPRGSGGRPPSNRGSQRPRTPPAQHQAPTTTRKGTRAPGTGTGAGGRRRTKTRRRAEQKNAEARRAHTKTTDNTARGNRTPDARTAHSHTERPRGPKQATPPSAATDGLPKPEVCKVCQKERMDDSLR